MDYKIDQIKDRKVGIKMGASRDVALFNSMYEDARRNSYVPGPGQYSPVKLGTIFGKDSIGASIQSKNNFEASK